MTLPAIRAIRLADLEPLDLALPPSGHPVKTVKWVDASGQHRQGVFKALDHHYPPILASFSVAVSVWLQMALGEFAAEDRLVFDEKQDIVGTVSLLIEDFVPLMTIASDPPADPEKNALANPSVETLLAHQIAIILVAAMLMKCDDRHPGNFGLRYDKTHNKRESFIIDNDMSFYSYTCYMKGFRSGYDGIFRSIMPKMMALLKHYLDNFPLIDGRVHWPTNILPLNGNPFKAYASRPAFLALVESAEFHKQTAERLLVHLLTYDPVMLEARLKLYLGKLPLAFKALDEIGVAGLTENYPELFNDETNKAPFYQMMLKLFQQEYDELYREVVYYSGCEANSRGLMISSFNQFIAKGPAFYTSTIAWAIAQNHLWEDAPQETHFNLSFMFQKMHQIWRDSYRPRVKLLVLHLNVLKQTVAGASWQLVDMGSEAIRGQDVPGLAVLEKYLLGFTQICQDYWDMVSVSPSLTRQIIEQANLDFCHHLEKLIKQHGRKIASNFQPHPEWHRSFLMINDAVKDLHGRLNWSSYISRAQDEEIPWVEFPSLPSIARSWDDSNVIQEYLMVLFDWAARPCSMPLIMQGIRSAIKQYKPSYFNPLAHRTRDQEVLAYLERILKHERTEEDPQANHDGANILASILSTNGLESNSLNTLILVELLPEVLNSVKSQIEHDFQCIEEALHKKIFDSVLYMGAARGYVRRDERFTHIYTYRKEVSFYHAMYHWVDEIPRDKFHGLVNQALIPYRPYSFNIFRLFNSREPTVRKYLEDPSLRHSHVLGLIFMTGGCNESVGLSAASLNHGLFEMIFDAMQIDIRKHPDKKRNEGFALVAEIDKLQALKYLASDLFQRIAKKWAGQLILPHQMEPMAASISV